jgi:glucose-6-phosphate isomerase
MIYPDQMGVELGKVLAKNILAQLNEPADVKGHDSSVSDIHLLDLD